MLNSRTFSRPYIAYNLYYVKSILLLPFCSPSTAIFATRLSHPQERYDASPTTMANFTSSLPMKSSTKMVERHLSRKQYRRREGLAKLLNTNVGADHKQKLSETLCHCWCCSILIAETAYGVCKSTIHVKYTPGFCVESFQALYREPLVNHLSKIKIELCAPHGLNSSQICAA